jgi:GH24 family phage-related lysozyme (muramidase)
MREFWKYIVKEGNSVVDELRHLRDKGNSVVDEAPQRPSDQPQVPEQEDAEFEKLLALREGSRNDVYPDSLGKPTVGIGHLVVEGDKLKVGDTITKEQVTAFFKKDSANAMSAARSQAAKAGIKDSAFIPYLASVNFQLGTGWIGEFPQTWKMIVDGNYEDAAKALDGTLWAKQTPVRVKDFQDALRKLPAKSSGPSGPAQPKVPDIKTQKISPLNLSPKAKKAAEALLEKYPDIIFTSGRRDLAEQAKAMAQNVVQARDYIKSTYKTNDAGTACQKWVDDHQDATTEDKIAAGLLKTLTELGDKAGQISLHLTGDAFDVQPVPKDAPAILKAMKELKGCTEFFEKEAGLVIWHVGF